MKSKKKKTYICRAEPAGIDGIPGEIKILPLGMVHSQKGDFIVDAKSFAEMQREFKERALDKVIDYEHQTLHDVQAPAAGWIKDLVLTNDAVVAKVEWNPKAAEYLKNKEYRYLSPVVRVRPSDNRAFLLHSVALTNTPAIDGMFSINKLNDLEGGLSDQLDEEDDEMDLKEFAVLLGLPEDADIQQIKKAIEDLLGEAKTLKEKEAPAAAPVVCKLLGLKEDAKAEDISAAIVAFKANAGETVSKADYLELKARIDKQDGEQLVEVALKSGKLTPDLKEWATEYALKDATGFKAFIDKAPEVVPMGEIGRGDDKKKADVASEDTLKVCKDLGVSKEDVEKYGKDVE